MTYWAINAAFLSVVAIVAILATLRVRRGRCTGVSVKSIAIAIAMGIVLILTAVFDNVMIGIGLVGYAEAKISGQFVGLAPLEDFAYAVAAVILLPSLWVLLGPRMTERHVSPQPGAISRSMSEPSE